MDDRANTIGLCNLNNEEILDRNPTNPFFL